MLAKIKSLVTLACIGALIIAVVVHKEDIIAIPGEIITAENKQPEKSDLLIPLLGNSYSRSKATARLFHQGVANEILFGNVKSGVLEELNLAVNDGNTTEKLLTHWGVPRDSINHISELIVTSTKDEAKVYLDYLTKKRPEIKSITIVTDWYHTTRAKWIFDHLNAARFKIQVAVATTKKKSAKTMV